MIPFTIIITPPIYNFSSRSYNIGGVETYIRDLSIALKDSSEKIIIVQPGNDQLEDQVNKITIRSVNTFQDNSKSYQKIYDLLFKENGPNGVYIIATDQINIKSKHQYTIAIQHGIAFDIPKDFIPGFWGYNLWLSRINKLLRCLRNISRFHRVRNSICVDYNYYNWYRTLDTIPKDKRVAVIPNYCSEYINNDELSRKLQSQNNQVKILFARRFVNYRGTIMFANVAKKLLDKYDHVDITFAGSGLLSDYLHKEFDNYARVTITSFESKESISFHKHFDIAVVPTIFSEGTSLSLCEAMAAGCYVVATHVGGMTNMIIDSFNGTLCAPEEKALDDALEHILNLPKLEFCNIVKNGHESAMLGFSYEKWKKRWNDFVKSIYY
ncbi:MAG: glycosyltransferase family 4 protein [Marinifilaceae bacterium]